MSDNEYTPTTNGVRNRYLWWYEAQQDRSPRKFTKYPDEVLAQFDRWLAAHDREVAAKALMDAADEYPGTVSVVQFRYWLRARAAALGVPVSESEGKK